MATVGGITCQIVAPDAPGSNKQRTETWIVPGLNGIGAHKLGANEAEWSFRLVKFGTDAQCDTWSASIEALQGTVIAVTDDHADPYTGLLMIGASNPQKSIAYHVLGLGAAGRRCEMRINGVFT